MRLSLRKSKKAADPNQIFIYIAAIVIVGFVFLYGFKAVTTFINSSKDIELAKFVKDFKTKASSVSTDFGSIQFVSIRIPSQFEQMCILESELTPPSDCADKLGAEVCDTWSEYTVDPTVERKNIFFLDHVNHVGYKDVISGIKIDAVAHPEGYLCTNDGRLKLEGAARVATVSIDDSE